MSPHNKEMNAKETMNYLKNSDSSLKLALFYGEEDYLIEQSITGIKKKFLSEGSEAMDFVKIDFEGKYMDVIKVRENTELPPWFSTKRIVLIKNANVFKSKETDDLKSIVDNLPDSTLLVFTQPSIDKKMKKLLGVFLENGIVGEFQYLDEVDLTNWTRKRFAKSQIGIDDAAVASIISRCDKSLRNIANEVDKLVLYCSAINQNYVTEREVAELCPPDVKGVIFDITNAIGTGDPGRALAILNNLIIQKEPCVKIRATLAGHIKRLICAKELGSKQALVSELKMNPYAAGKLVSQAAGFSLDQLTKLYIQCSEDDRNFKMGKADERQSLESFIVRACLKK